MDPQPLLEKVKYDAQGLVSAIAQDHPTGRVLMLAYMNEATLRQTLETGVMTYWSRSRQKVWVKGETSGNVQRVREAFVDCDGDALLFQVEQVGEAACHTGHVSCFYRRVEADGALAETEPPVFDAGAVYGR
jgi:phosphoribosyl-AMP cyclohydrolase